MICNAECQEVIKDIIDESRYLNQAIRSRGVGKGFDSIAEVQELQESYPAYVVSNAESGKLKLTSLVDVAVKTNLEALTGNASIFKSSDKIWGSKLATYKENLELNRIADLVLPGARASGFPIDLGGKKYFLTNNHYLITAPKEIEENAIVFEEQDVVLIPIDSNSFENPDIVGTATISSLSDRELEGREVFLAGAAVSGLTQVKGKAYSLNPIINRLFNNPSESFSEGDFFILFEHDHKFLTEELQTKSGSTVLTKDGNAVRTSFSQDRSTFPGGISGSSIVDAETYEVVGILDRYKRRILRETDQSTGVDIPKKLNIIFFKGPNVLSEVVKEAEKQVPGYNRLKIPQRPFK